MKERILMIGLTVVCLVGYAYAYEIEQEDAYTVNITDTITKRITLTELRAERAKVNAKIDRHVARANEFRAERDLINEKIDAIIAIGVVDAPVEVTVEEE